jgi:16S rRNA C1402 N4-methylase RsmH
VSAAFPKVKEQSISAVITKADGTVIDLGVVSYRNANPFKTFAWYLRHPEQWGHKLRKFLRWVFRV